MNGLLRCFRCKPAAPSPTMLRLEEDPRVATGKQPRGQKFPPVISEFDETKTIRCRDIDAPLLDDKNRRVADFYGVPTGSKLLRKAPVNKGDPSRPTARLCGSLVSSETLLLFSSWRRTYNALLTVFVQCLQRS